jgi:hypothetical protein
MHNVTKRTLCYIVILFITVAGPSCSFRALSGGSSGYLVWNNSEAYVFIEVADLRFRATGPRVPWILFKRNVIGGFAAYEPPVDQRAFLVVIRVTSSGVERHIMKLADRLDGGPGSDPYGFTPMNGQIYASCPWLIRLIAYNGQLIGGGPDDGLCKWAGDRFERATDGERRRLGGIKGLSKTDFVRDSSGWSRRELVAGPSDRKFTIAVGDEFRLSINVVAHGIERSTLSIDLLRAGKPAERIGVFDAHEGNVSNAEYERVFGNSP